MLNFTLLEDAVNRDWEAVFRSWAKPPGKTEQEKCENAERAIRKAIDASSALNSRNITVFQQGSYYNRTNVRTESDVDICILCADTLFGHYPSGMTGSDFGLVDATYTYSRFKDDVEEALVDHFGSKAVTRGNKAFDIHENTYRVDADAVACFEYRYYFNDGTYLKPTGTSFDTDNGKRIHNWPDQHYDNGVAKNTATGRRYKAVVRILKSLRSEMADDNYPEAETIPGFLLECLVWNVPNRGFGHDSYSDDVRYALAYLFSNTQNKDDCKNWCEVNDIKYLFHPTQQWTKEQANAFLDAAWNYIGFE